MEETQQKSIPELIEQLYDVVSVQLRKLRFDRCIHELKQLQRKPISTMTYETVDSHSRIEEASSQPHQQPLNNEIVEVTHLFEDVSLVQFHKYALSETNDTPQEKQHDVIGGKEFDEDHVEDLRRMGKCTNFMNFQHRWCLENNLNLDLEVELAGLLELLKYDENWRLMVRIAVNELKDGEMLCSIGIKVEFHEWKGGTAMHINGFIIEASLLTYQTRGVGCYPNGIGYALSSVEGRVALKFFDFLETSQAENICFKCQRKSVTGWDFVYPVNAMAFHTVCGLLYLTQALDLIYYSRCRINWTSNDGILLLRSIRCSGQEDTLIGQHNQFMSMIKFLKNRAMKCSTLQLDFAGNLLRRVILQYERNDP